MPGPALTRIVALAALAIAPATLAACAGDLQNPERFGLGRSDGGTTPGADGSAPASDGGGGGGETWTAVLADNCAGSGCHGETSPALGLDLVSDGVGERLVNVDAVGCGDRVLVVPGDPDASFLLEKIESATPECGGRMPLLGTALSDEQIAVIRTWIEGLSP